MDQRAVLGVSLEELRRVAVSLDDSELDTDTNCEPWTVRRLGSHALNNQLLWGGVASGQELVSVEETMGAAPHDGDLTLFANSAVRRAREIWDDEEVLEAVHATPFGELPGTVVIDFPTIDAFAHAWDLSASLGRPIEFPPAVLPEITALVERTCTDAIRDLGLIKPPTEPPADATDTERLMALAGRTIPR